MTFKVIKQVPQIRIFPDPGMPKYRDITGWKRYFPIEFIKTEFYFKECEGDFYCNPAVLEVMRRRLTNGL